MSAGDIFVRPEKNACFAWICRGPCSVLLVLWYNGLEFRVERRDSAQRVAHTMLGVSKVLKGEQFQKDLYKLALHGLQSCCLAGVSWSVLGESQRN